MLGVIFFFTKLWIYPPYRTISPPPPNLTKSQPLYKFSDLGNFFLGGGGFPPGGEGGER